MKAKTVKKTTPEQTAFFNNSACALVTEGDAENWRKRWSKGLPSKIIDFYTAEMILISNPDELTAQRMRNRQARTLTQLEDFFRTYLYITCYGETRHINRGTDRTIDRMLYSIKYCRMSGRHSAWTEAYNQLKTITETELKHHVQTMEDLFNYSGAYNGGFGGVKWAKIAETLGDFINGNTSGKIFVDTCISLCHNNQFFIDKILGENYSINGSYADFTVCYLNLKFNATDLKYYWDYLSLNNSRDPYRRLQYIGEMPNVTAIIEEYKPVIIELIGG